MKDASKPDNLYEWDTVSLVERIEDQQIEIDNLKMDRWASAIVAIIFFIVITILTHR